MASDDKAMFSSFFSLGRNRPFPSNYKEIFTAAKVDVLEAGWIAAFISVYLCFLLVLPARSGIKQLFYFARVTVSLFVGLSIMMVNFGHDWEVGEIGTETSYKAGSNVTIHANVSLRLSLRSVNITLKEIENSASPWENIDYNERFYYTGDQGRFGFGQFAGQLQRDFRAAQFRGVPYPILWVAEYFIFDGEGLRYGRNYRLAGTYCIMCLWTALLAWILTLILFRLVISYGAKMLMFLGVLMCISSLIWAFRRNFLELSIHFAGGSLETHFGFHWYLCLCIGMLCIIGGAFILVMDNKDHILMCRVMNIDPFSVYEEEYQEQVIEEPSHGDSIPMVNLPSNVKTIRRTVTIRSKGTTCSTRHFTTTNTADLPIDYTQMETQETEDIYADDYLTTHQAQGGYNTDLPVYKEQVQNMEYPMAEQYQIVKGFAIDGATDQLIPANEIQNADYGNGNMAVDVHSEYCAVPNEYIDGYGQHNYSYQYGDNEAVMQNYNDQSQQAWTDTHYPPIPPRQS